MRSIVIKQRRSIYNKQNIKNVLFKICKDKKFSIKEKGKHSYSIFFDENIDSGVVGMLSKKLGLSIVYQSEVRSILEDRF